SLITPPYSTYPYTLSLHDALPILYRLGADVEEKLITNEQKDLLEQLEMPLSLILGEMEHTGVRVDVNRLQDMGEELKERLANIRSEEHTSELQSRFDLVCRLLLEK